MLDVEEVGPRAVETAAQLMQQLADADNAIATARGALKGAEEAYEKIADKVFALMDEQGTETIRNSSIGLQVTISESETETIHNWPDFEKFVLRHKLLSMFQRRLSVKAIREWNDANPKKQVPGLGKFAKRRLSVTTITKKGK